MKLGVVILAAGQGTRMKSRRPKVLHPIAGKPMLAHVIETAQRFEPESVVVVYGHGGELVRERMQSYDVDWVLQQEQLGTGHAVQQAMPGTPDDNGTFDIVLTVEDEDGGHPVLSALSEIAGQMAVHRAADLLEHERGGRGIVLGNVPGIPPPTVVVLAGIRRSQCWRWIDGNMCYNDIATLLTIFETNISVNPARYY